MGIEQPMEEWVANGVSEWSMKEGTANRVFSRPVAFVVVNMETLGQTNQPSMITWSPPITLSDHADRLQQALPLARNNRELLIFRI